MNTKIKGRLKILFPKAHLSNKRLDEISARLKKTLETDSTEEVIDDALNASNVAYPFAEIAKMDDRIASYEHKLSKLKDDDDGGDSAPDTDTESGTDPKTSDMPEWAKGFTETITNLSTKIEELESGKALDQKKSSAKKVFEGSKVFSKAPDQVKNHFFSQVNVDSDTPVEEQLEELEGLYNNIIQAKKDNSTFAGSPPNSNGFDNEASKKMVGSIADDIMR